VCDECESEWALEAFAGIQDFRVLYFAKKKGSFSAILLEENVLKCHALNYVCILHYVLHVMYYCKYSDTSYSLLTSAEEFLVG
jgi:hypothetical protein